MFAQIQIYQNKYRVNLNKWLLTKHKDWCISRSYPWASHMPIKNCELIMPLNNLENEQLKQII